MSDVTASATRDATTTVGELEAHRGERSSLRALAESQVVPVAIVVALALAMPILVLIPPPYGDAYHVFQGSQLWPNIPADTPAIHQLMRIGLLLPVRGFREVLGDGQVAFFVASTLLNALLALGTYAAAAALFGRIVGVAAVAILFLHPFFVIVDPYGAATSSSTGSLLPDMPASGLFALGVAGVVAAARRTGRPELVLLLLAGTCFGLAYLIREFVALMYWGIPIFLLLVGISLRRLLVVGAPMVALFGIELVHNALVFGDPIARLRVAAGHGEIVAPLLDAPPSPIEVLGRFVTAMTTHPLGVLFLAALAINAIAWLVTRDRRLLLTLAWFLALWIPLTLLAGLVNPDSPSLRSWFARYWTPVLPALLAGGLGAIVVLAGRIAADNARRAVLGTVAVALAVGFFVPALAALASLPRDAAWNELRGWLAGRADMTQLWTDVRTAQTLTFYTRTPLGDPLWSGTVSTFRARSPTMPEAAAEGPLLFTPQYGPRERPSEEDGWRVVWQSSDGKTLTLWDR